MIKRLDPLVVPKGIRYISDWGGFEFNNLPAVCILNKQLPGCGFTEYCLRGKENVILCSPRKMLLQNKYDQHQGEVYLVVNETDREISPDKDLRRKSRATFEDDGSDEDAKLSSAERLQKEKDLVKKKSDIFNRLTREIKEYVSLRQELNEPVKILVTYDSYRIVLEILDLIEFNFPIHTVVDEYQTLIHDARFKADVELNFFTYLEKSKRTYFVSATPMMEEYMNMLEEFNGIPYLELDWSTEDPGRIIRPDLKVLTMKSTGYTAKQVVKAYLSENYEKSYRKVDDKLIEIESTEAVLYVNSVNHIINIISATGLKPGQCNILCADTPSNRGRIRRKLGRTFTIGRVPVKGEVNKPFTFCTRTVYLGADFYSKCARSFIFADSNIESLAVDISEDLPQILGRQRDDENPWKLAATFYYTPIGSKNITTAEELEKMIENKKEATKQLLSAYKTALPEAKGVVAKKYENDVKSSNYKDDYVSLKQGIPVLNNFVLINDIRSFKIQQIDYRDRVSVFSKLTEEFNISCGNMLEAKKFMEEYYSKSTYYDKMKMLCNASISKESLNIVLDQIPDNDKIKVHYIVLGRDRCKALAYNSTWISDEIDFKANNNSLAKELQKVFINGSRYSRSDIKDELVKIKSTLGLRKSIKVLDLVKYFELEECRFMSYDEKSGEKKRVRGYKILGKKKL